LTPPSASRVLAARPRARILGVDILLGGLLFLVSATLGGAYYARAIASAHHPFFYQTYFEPAVMVACGKGFLVAQPQPPAVRAFLFQETDRFSCDELPSDLKLGTRGLYQRPWRYLMTTVAIAWKALGVSWSGLAPLFGVFFGATTLLAYALCRQIVGRVAAAAAAAALSASPLQLSNLPNLRDYAKAPFTLALVLILIALVVRPWRRRDVLLLALGYGLILGIGYGFRTDLLVDIPPFLIAVALFLPGGVLRNLPTKIAAVVLSGAGFIAAGWPIITTVASSGGCQWHVFLLGLASPFNDALGVKGGSYEWGHLYKDEYLWATVSGYANRLRPDLGYIDYCSHEYDVASWEYLRHILLTFPADMMTRAYASALQVLGLPFERVAALTFAGPVLAAALVLAVGSASLRLALFAVFVMVYFGGHPAIQFLPRHYFPFEVITLLVMAFLAERAARLAINAAKGNRAERASASQVRRAAACAAIVATMLLMPLALLRWYQNGRATRLLETYVALPTSPTPLVATAPGQFRTPAEPGSRVLSPVEAIEALGRAKTRFVSAQVDAAACARGTTVTFRYDPGYPATDFSRTVTLEWTVGHAGPTRLFEPVYAGFQGIDVSDASPVCVPRVSVVNGVDRLPLLLSAQLPPGWESQSQYQRIAQSR
jgi:hypothetical protein